MRRTAAAHTVRTNAVARCPAAPTSATAHRPPPCPPTAHVAEGIRIRITKGLALVQGSVGQSLAFLQGSVGQSLAILQGRVGAQSLAMLISKGRVRWPLLSSQQRAMRYAVRWPVFMVSEEAGLVAQGAGTWRRRCGTRACSSRRGATCYRRLAPWARGRA